MIKVKTADIYRFEELEVSAKGDKVAIEVFDSGNWNCIVIDRDRARTLAEQLLAWCAQEPDGGSAF